MAEQNNDNIGNQIQEEILIEFKENVKNWVNIDDTIREKNEELKKLKKEKKGLESSILDSMEILDYPICGINGGKLRKTVSKTRGALKQTLIRDTLTKVFNDIHKANITTQMILDNRPVIEKKKLKRTFNRKSE